MISTTTGDVETIRELAETIKTRRGDIEAWTRWGSQLRAHRELSRLEEPPPVR